MTIGARSTPGFGIARWPGEARITALGGATALLYLAGNWATRALFLNGAPPGVGGASADHAPSVDTMWPEFGSYVVVTVLLFAAYLAVLSLCRRGALQGDARRWALVIPGLLTVLLVGFPPVLSEDVFSYMAHGYLGAMPGGNPLLQAADSVARTPIGPSLAAFGWHGEIGITPYGIVWTRIEVAIMQLCGTHVVLALVLLKSVVAAASLGTGFGIWTFLGRVRPAAQLYGTLAYLWNPLILAEFAGEGHNDAVMLFFVVASLAACAAQRPATSLVTQLLGVLTKYVSVLFLPAQAMYLWHTRRSVGGLAARILIALLVTLGMTTLLYGSLWAGMQSFDGLLHRGSPTSSASLAGAINWLLRRTPLASYNGPLTVAAVTLPLLAFIGWASLRVRDANGLARTIAWISVGYVLLSSPDFWPWYACMPVALLIAADAESLGWLAVLMSLTARLCAPLDLIHYHEFIGMMAARGTLTGLCTTVPLLVLVIWAVRRRDTLRAQFA